jgi:hypothetical protein
MVIQDSETVQTAVANGADHKALGYSQAVVECQHKHTAKFVVVDHQEQGD